MIEGEKKKKKQKERKKHKNKNKKQNSVEELAYPFTKSACILEYILIVYQLTNQCSIKKRNQLINDFQIAAATLTNDQLSLL